MSAVLHVADGPGELRLAVLEAEGIVAAEVHRSGQPDRVEELHLARVVGAATGAAGWFVRLHDADAFLPRGEVPRGRGPLRDGEAVVARIARAAMGGKGLRVSIKRVPEVPPGPAAPRLLAPAPDPVARLATLFAAPVARAHAFPPAVEEDFAALLDPEMAIPGGGRIRLTPAPAATLVDVDAGGAAPDQANRQAARAVARQIRARNLSGVILIDFAALDGIAAKRRMAEALRADLAADPLKAEVTGHSPAGLIEVVRRKIRPPLHELLCEPQPAFRPSALTLGLAALRRALAEALARPALRPALRAHPRVVAALEQEATALASFAQRAGAAIVLAADPLVAPGAERLEDARGR
jgi:hypothetical protein